jgi:hypothetical protein
MQRRGRPSFHVQVGRMLREAHRLWQPLNSLV